MRFNFDLTDPNPNSTPTPPKEEDTRWLPLQSHPIFSSSSDAASTASSSSSSGAPKNLVAWDGASSRIYYWDSNNRCIHRVSLRLEPTSLLAASPSKVLVGDVAVDFEVDRISINRNGSAILLLGTENLCVMRLYGRTSPHDNTIICRTVSVGSHIYFGESKGIRVLQVSWHPYSDMHLAILSSDSVFRLFNMSSDLLQPEQEYYLQPVVSGTSQVAASICPVDFSFGADHLWDRFSVFVLFTEGSVYILCPIVPFGSVCKWNSILELYEDAHTFGLESANPAAVSNSNLAISWLEGTYPELIREGEEGNPPAVKAKPHVLFDASLCLQGPLCRVRQGSEEDTKLAIKGVGCEGHAVSLLYNLISKDSILVIAWSAGQLQIDALADEIHPVWTVGNPPRVRVDSYDHILGLAMICESISIDLPNIKLDQTLDGSVWLGHPPPLLGLAIIDLALPRMPESASHITMYIDPLMSERIYALHEGGIDSVILHYLPFTNQSSGKDDSVRAPSVHPVLNTCQAENFVCSLCGFVALSDSFGCSWIVGVTSSRECVVLEMKTWDLLLPINVDVDKSFTSLEDIKEGNVPEIISKELLSGPKVVLVPQASPNLRSVAANSIEGRSTLHQYFKIFHENYVEYAHKVYFELKHHGPQLKRIIDDQHIRLNEAQEKLSEVEKKQCVLDNRIEHILQQNKELEQRLQRLRNLPGVHRKPLSRAERSFKSELDNFVGVELDALRKSIDTLDARLRRYMQSSRSETLNRQRKMSGKDPVQDAQISQLKSAIEKLSLVNSENSKKVKLVESALKSREITG